MASATPIRSRLWRLLAGFLPAMGRPAARETLLSGAGVTLCVLVSAGVIALTPLEAGNGVFLIAPIGASALLVVAVPNSPLAQPWSVMVGNTGAALIGVAAVMLVPWLPVAASLAVGGAVVFMLLARALHPPAGGMALATVLSTTAVEELGFRFALTPVALDCALLLGVAIAWHRLTGRVYPFRRPGGRVDPLATATTASDGPTDADLAAILARMRLSANLGVADFARLIAAVDEIAAADRRCAGLTCGQVMTPDPVAVGPDTPLAEATALILSHNVHSLPVIDPAGRLVGILSQATLLRATVPVAAAGAPGRGAGNGGWPDHQTDRPAATGQAAPVPAADPASVAGVMTRDVVAVEAASPLSQALTALAGGGYQAVPVVEDGRLVGIISRSDLIDVLASRPA